MSRIDALPLCLALLLSACTSGPSATNSATAPIAASPSGVDQPPPVDEAILGEACQFGAVVFDVGPVALCANGVALALQRLGPLHWPVASIDFILSLCPPGAPCAVPTEKEGWVIFTFVAAPPLMVHVGPFGPIAGVDGPLTADAPQEVPAWLVAQLAGGSGP